MVMTIENALKLAQEQLKNNGIESFYIDSLLLLCKVLNVDKTRLMIDRCRVLTTKEEETFFSLIQQRKNHMPVKYLTNLCEFMSLDFYVDSNVLIPRPDTEIAVEEALNLFSKDSAPRILDLCCGSGCIGISLAHYLPHATCLMVDLSPEALRIAERNIHLHALNHRVSTLKADVLTDEIVGMFDLIISNPPYISEEEFLTLEPDVRDYEPKMALVSPRNQNLFYETIADRFYQSLKPGGFLIFEISYSQGNEIKKHLQDTCKYSDIRLIRDLGGNHRVIIARAR